MSACNPNCWYGEWCPPAIVNVGIAFAIVATIALLAALIGWWLQR